MEWIQKVKELIEADFVQAIVAVISMLCGMATIMQAMNPTKRIRYRIARNGNVYALCFWNASAAPVFSDDVFHFYAIVNDQASTHMLYRTDLDLPLECKLSEKADICDSHTGNRLRGKFKTLDFYWEFLPSRAGAIAEICNNTSLTINHGVIVNGRIKGGKANSISIARLPLEINRKSTSKRGWIVDAFANGLMILLYGFMTCMVLSVLYLEPNNMLGWISVLGMLVFDFVWIREIMLNSMPYKLRQAFKKVCKERKLEVDYEKHDHYECVYNPYYETR